MSDELDLPWQETDEDVTLPHAFFGGCVCWLKNGEDKCGKTYNDPIHTLEEIPCEHSYRCENCDDEIDPKEFRKAVLKEAADMCREMAQRYYSDIEGCDAHELDRYCEGVENSKRLAEIIEADEMHKWVGGQAVEK